MLPTQGVGALLVPPLPCGASDLAKRAAVPSTACDVAIGAHGEAIVSVDVPLPRGQGLPPLHAVINTTTPTKRIPPLLPKVPPPSPAQTRILEVTIAGPLTTALSIRGSGTTRLLPKPSISRTTMRLPQASTRTLSNTTPTTSTTSIPPQTIHTTRGTTRITQLTKRPPTPMQLQARKLGNAMTCP